MSIDLLPALLAFCFVGVITPGPNNLMLMASGANYGFRRTVPHMMGVGLGMPVLVVLVGIGIIRVFETWPIVQTVLTVLSVAYLLFLAWKIATAAPPARTGDVEVAGKPLTFLQAALFQWVNPKAWFMALSAITLYAAGRDPLAILWVAGAYVGVSTISTTSWTALGQQMRRFLGSPMRLRVFNWTMAALLVATLIPVLWPA
ncbi:LysE family translocator [Roseovarius sp. SCSIO 43702]|uniref:LysE family translocator n=1 Tax=Roseovarius sp. SCSIO 43702 TaxID=2823043 RepID=UPI001C732EC7|nr:LysE family translocator [Roseovarius sp. SCSIO 43702]QYX57314.1 LysE family translocator [Roseovarius sp. SCSIO 43702]